jgi:hypothetical protein
MNSNLYVAMCQAETDWHCNVGEHDRKAGGRLDQMFIASGYSRFGVPKAKGDKVPEWCGMAVVSWLLAGGLNPAHNLSFLHCLNVEAFFTYGARKNVNPRRLKTEVEVGGEWQKIKQWQADKGQKRRWSDRAACAAGIATGDKLLFQAGDVLLLDWSGGGAGAAGEADHIAMVRHWDPASKVLTCIEGNRTGKGPDGKTRKESVVKKAYDLKLPRQAALVYGVGRLSPYDFGSETLR